MGITPHIPTQNRTCPIKAYGFSLHIPYYLQNRLTLILGSNNGNVLSNPLLNVSHV